MQRAIVSLFLFSLYLYPVCIENDKLCGSQDNIRFFYAFNAKITSESFSNENAYLHESVGFEIRISS